MHKDIFLLGVKISLSSKKDILEIIEKYVKKSKVPPSLKLRRASKNLVIFTPNPEIVMFAQKHPWFKKIVNSGQINIPDGAGLVLGAKLLGYPIKERIAGSDLTGELISLASRKKIVIGLIGGFDNLALEALECQRGYYPNLQGWAEEGPEIKVKSQKLKVKSKEELFIDSENKNSEKCQSASASQSPNLHQSLALKLDCGSWDIDKFVKRVKERKTGILLVGFGFPKQEIFIKEIVPKLDGTILMAVGGTFAYLSGRIPRAPKVLQLLGLEWLYRLYKEPWRIRRQIVLPKFILKVIARKILIQNSEL